jgi:tetratricopeptide (TPR) repeat protein
MAKSNPKDLNKPDVFQERIFAVSNYIREHKKYVYIGIGAAMGIILLIAGWYFYRMDYEKKAQKAYDEAFNTYHFMTAKPNDEENMRKIIGMYQEVAKQYPNSRAAAYASFSIGNLYYNLKEYNQSIKAYQSYIDASATTKDLKSIAFSGIGYCYEAMGQDSKAIEAYENATRNSIGDAFSSMTYLNIARLYDRMKNNQKALEYYKKASEQKNDALTKALVQRKIAELDSSK